MSNAEPGLSATDGLAALIAAAIKWSQTEYGAWNEVEVDAELRDAITDYQAALAQSSTDTTAEQPDVLREALTEIRDEQGRVCDQFEVCRHAACRSSYASWAIADKALEQARSLLQPQDTGPCIFQGCVSRDRHWHGGFPGGYTNPADPEGAPILFTTEPAPGVRDYNGALLQPQDTEGGE